MGFALGEALAHLNYLMHEGALARELSAPVYPGIKPGNDRLELRA